MQPSNRIQENIVARQERRFLDWCCSRIPDGVTSDHLTLLGVAGAFLVLGGYCASRLSPAYLVVSVLGYAVHWFGDSMDGSLARHRKVTRPRYGYFLDHSLDAFCILLMIGGMGVTHYVRTDVALVVVVGYLLLCIHVFLRNHVTGTFQLSFMALGPTELRMVFAALTLFMLLGGEAHWAGSVLLSDCDIVLLITSSIFVALFTKSTATTILQLRALEGDGRLPLQATDTASARPLLLGAIKESNAY